MQSSHAKEAVNVYYFLSGTSKASSMFTKILALYIGLHVNRGRKLGGQKLSTL